MEGQMKLIHILKPGCGRYTHRNKNLLKGTWRVDSFLKIALLWVFKGKESLGTSLSLILCILLPLTLLKPLLSCVCSSSCRNNGPNIQPSFPACPVWMETRAGKAHKRKLCFTLAKIPNDSREHPRGTPAFWMDPGHPGQPPSFAKADLLRLRHMEGCGNAPALFSFSGWGFFQVYLFKTEALPWGKTKTKSNFFEKSSLEILCFGLALQNQTFEKLKWVICE